MRLGTGVVYSLSRLLRSVLCKQNSATNSYLRMKFVCTKTVYNSETVLGTLLAFSNKRTSVASLSGNVLDILAYADNANFNDHFRRKLARLVLMILSC